ncbi:hypothetical protein NUACC21_54050 [Scytonema sp. NUACC21]
MIIKKNKYQINAQLSLYNSSQSPINIYSFALSVSEENNQFIEFRLTFQANVEFYKRIEVEALFNLKPEIHSFFSSEKFQQNLNITIEATLKPDLLPELAPHVTTAEEAANYLLQLSQENPNHRLLYTENWLALSVTQQQEHGEVGYTTLWATLNPAAIAGGTITETEIAQALTSFFSDWAEANLGTLTEKATSQILEEVGNLFNEFADTSIEAISQVATSSETILEQMLNFFTEDDWQFTKLQGEPILSMAFQGQNGEWTCYAKAREEQQQFVFYSLCPITASQDKRLAVAEFLTRANYGMMIGNFELDFTDGEIRYKTGINVAGESLSFTLIKNLVYTNVMMMDEYLPGIISVINGDVEAEKAIAQIESIPETLSE